MQTGFEVGSSLSSERARLDIHDNQDCAAIQDHRLTDFETSHRSD